MVTVTSKLAIDGGEPVRASVLPYGRQIIDESDIGSMIEVLRSDWLTTGPMVEAFEVAVADYVGAKFAVAVSSGTAALHAATYALGVGPGDEVIVPPMTFAATANAVIFQGATPVFADVDPDGLLIDPIRVEENITERTKAIVAVDYAGQPCDYDALRLIANRHGLALVADACHALGATYKGEAVGTLADLSVFSFHPVKHITTGEGGLITTNDEELARRMRTFRNHGITTDHRQRSEKGCWFYEMVDLGFNYRLTDLQCVLGISQLRRLPEWNERRRLIASRYDRSFSNHWGLRPLGLKDDVSHAYHLYVIRLVQENLSADRNKVFAALRAEGIGVNVHYVPVHLHPYYREKFGTGPGHCPVAETAYERILSLPMFPAMSDGDVDDVITATKKVLESYAL